LPQGYKHSPTLAPHVLAQELEVVQIGEGVSIYQYIDDILVGGNEVDRGGMTCIPLDTLSLLDQIKMPESKRDLQHVLGLLMFWRKHI
ncbi:hypothetical protein FQV10_0007424, partial [Eudyptes schlegeli]